MSEQKSRTGLWLVALVCAIILIAAGILAVLRQQPSSQTQTKPESIDGPKISLNDVIRTARSWAPAYKSWYGKTAPDFTLTDITGNQHKLSDYRGKNVMIIFWATWCIPCHLEIPHLIALRNTVSEDKLAMLAISDEYPALVKRFAADRKINYTVISANILAMPSPYNSIMSIPCNFFIDPEGKIKLATEGVLSLDAIKAILQAE
jgi:peroxiredoxin